MKYQDILIEFGSKFPNTEIEDYRPAFGLYIDGMDDCEQIPNAIVVWLKDGSKVVYISKSQKMEQKAENKKKTRTRVTETDLTNKCGSCKWAVPDKKSFIHCTYPNKRARFFVRTDKACKNYEMKE